MYMYTNASISLRYHGGTIFSAVGCLYWSVCCCEMVVSRGFSFYLPHGLTVDGHGNFWMTDVAMHQVTRSLFAYCCYAYAECYWILIVIIPRPPYSRRHGAERLLSHNADRQCRVYRLPFLCLSPCPQDFLSDISGVGWRRAMKFGRVVDLGG